MTALFGEKYGDFVRVLEVGNFSKELCGGTHVAPDERDRPAQDRRQRAASARTCAASRRVTSFDAYDFVRGEETELAQAAEAFKVPSQDVAERAASSVRRIKELESQAKSAKTVMGEGEIGKLLEGVIDVGYPLLVEYLGEGEADQLRGFSDVLRQRMGGGAVVLAVNTAKGEVILLAAGDDAAVAHGFNAGLLIKEVAALVGGRGGGKPNMAQGGGNDSSGIDAALEAARAMLGVEPRSA